MSDTNDNPTANLESGAATPYVIIVLDGWGHSDEQEDNAIALANTPTWDQLMHERPHCLISGSGLDVGLPEGQMGNSEVGHMNLGAGRVVDQDFTRINKAIEDGSFFLNPVLTATFRELSASGKALHLLGLLSPGGVHSHESHLQAAIGMAARAGVSPIYLHAFLDGRDVPPRSALASLEKMTDCLAETESGCIASIIGRYFVMDRDNRWERVEPAYRLLCDGAAEFTASTATEALEAAYSRGESDEFVQATAIHPNGKPITIEDGDAIVFMNFRADRAREITRAFTEHTFDGFTRSRCPSLAEFVSLTEYSDDMQATPAFTPGSLTNGLGEYVSKLSLSQLRLAETEKYAHVTFFFSGGREANFPFEDRILIPSPGVATYDLQPQMSAVQVTDELVKAITNGQYDLIVCNYANGDMVGHTGNLSAAIEAVECLDQCMARIVDAVNLAGGHCLITADHGNVEKMSDHITGQAHTAHTTGLVPLVYVGSAAITLKATGGTLSDVAPTLLAIMNLQKPDEMTGISLINPAIDRTGEP